MAAGEMDPYLRLLVEQREGEGRGGVWDHSAHTSSLLLSAWSRLRLARGLIGSATETPKTLVVCLSVCVRDVYGQWLVQV